MENRPTPLRSRRVCRFCLSENEPLNFIYDRELSRPLQVPLALQIMSCVGIEVYSADGMPQMICTMCRWNLDRCYKFKHQCKKADEALRAYPISGVLPRPFSPIMNDPPEQNNKRTLESRPASDQAKKPRIDNGDRERERERREVPHPGQRERQGETLKEKQLREKDERRDLYDEDQDAGSEMENEPNDGKDNMKLEPGEIRVHTCNQCDRTFPLLQSLQLHVQRAHRDRDYKCTECERMFFSKYDLKKHMATHTEEKPYSCQICQKQFTRANLLQRHEKIHREELRYGCPHCDREFFTTEELEKHEEAVHKTVKPYQCNICNKQFTYQQGLERHEMLHNEDKSFVCEYCKEAFRTSSKLARHLTTHAGHRPYLCKLCPRSFVLSHHLTRHMRSHSVEKKHQCEDCDKAFKRKESLEVHQLTHIKRSGMNLSCDVCQESCRNRADFVTHIKQHIEAGEKIGPDGLPPENKDKLTEIESEDDEEEEEQYSDGDDDYEPPASYLYSKKIQKLKNEEETLEKEEKKEQVVYVRGKDGNVVKKTIKTLMPIQRRNETVPEAKPKTTGSPQVVSTKQIKQDEMQPQATPQKAKVDETEAQVQKIVASVFKEHKIPLKHQGAEQSKESSQLIQKPASQSVSTPTIIKEEKIDPPLINLTQKNINTVKVLKRIVVRKPVGSIDTSATTISTPIKEAIQEAIAASSTPSTPQLAVTPSTSGPKVTKRVIVRRIIRQGDTTREVIMNPDGTIIDPAELAKLPAGNVVKRVVVKKPLDKGQNIEAMLQCADAKRIIRMAESGEDITKTGTIIASPVTIAHKQRVENQPQKQVVIKDDRETKEKLEQLEKRVEQQRLKIEELQARKHEYDACDDMMPERHDESEDEQQLPLKRVFVKRKQSIYDEEREYNDDSSLVKDSEENSTAIAVSSKEIMKEEESSQASVTFEEKVDKVVSSPTRSLEDAKIIIIKPEENQPDVDEMSRELCNILDSTETVVKMQESVLNNLTQITSINETSTHKTYATIHQETPVVEQMEATVTTEEPAEEKEIVSEEVEQNQKQIEEASEQQDPTLRIVITQSEEEGVKLQFEGTTENNQIEVTAERSESGLSALSTQVLSETNDIFETSETAMEVDKSQEQPRIDESVIELSSTQETINLNETTDSRDSLEDKLSQMEG